MRLFAVLAFVAVCVPGVVRADEAAVDAAVEPEAETFEFQVRPFSHPACVLPFRLRMFLCQRVPRPR